MSVNKIIKKRLLEVSENKEKFEISKTLFEKRLDFILGKNFDEYHFNKLSEEEVIYKFFKIAESYRKYFPSQPLNEGVLDFIKMIFGSRLFSGAAETFTETLVDNILSKIGLKGTFKNSIVSLVATDPSRLMRAMSDCRELTKLLSESIIEGIVMSFEDKSAITDNPIFGGIRNIVGDAIRESSVVQQVENKIAETVCALFGSYKNKAETLVDKLKK